MKKGKPKNPVLKAEDAQKIQKPKEIQVNSDNALPLTVHFLSKIYGRLGYMIKLLEERKK
jgi:hypothetical protein